MANPQPAAAASPGPAHVPFPAHRRAAHARDDELLEPLARNPQPIYAIAFLVELFNAQPLLIGRYLSLARLSPHALSPGELNDLARFLETTCDPRLCGIIHASLNQVLALDGYQSIGGELLRTPIDAAG